MRFHGPSAACAADDGLVLADGMRLLLRPLSTDDRAGLAALFARLTPESRYRRFLSPKRALTPRELTYFTDIDHLHHEAFAAVDRRDGSIVGVGRYVHEADRAGVAAVAVEVADELQGMGIGTALARRVVRRARVNGFALLTATALWENRSARALLRRLGFHARGSDGGVIDLELELDSTSGRVAGAASDGSQAGEARIGEVVEAGGLERFRRAAETPFNLVYEARPERPGTPDQPASSPTAAPNFARHAR
jgi:RimJ/RimL family protein N-acetyltransferase